MQQREQDPLSVQGTNDDSILSKRYLNSIRTSVAALLCLLISLDPPQD